MFVDQTSLLLALGIACFALCLTLLVTWLSARAELFILVWAFGAGVLVLAFGAFSIYAVSFDYALGWIANYLLSTSFVIIYGAACLFCDQRLPMRRLVLFELALLVGLAIPYALGLNALAAMAANLVNGALLLLTAQKFWTGRAEAPQWIGGIVSLYLIAALSFVPCAVMIYLKGPLVLDAPPSGWAEDVNSIAGLIGVTGIGALSLALNQARIARRHREEARTDPLTGLVNRRALFDLFGIGPMPAHSAVIVLDLDHFKSINDQYGHAAGDMVLRHFAGMLAASVRPGDVAARLGGEEFCLVVHKTSAEAALRIGERICASFASGIIPTPAGGLRCTVSAGLAYAADGEKYFDALVSEADKALYLAKDSGRNRVFVRDTKVA